MTYINYHLLIFISVINCEHFKSCKIYVFLQHYLNRWFATLQEWIVNDKMSKYELNELII